MSENEGSTSVIDLEGKFRTIDVELPEIEGTPEQTEEKPAAPVREKPAKKVRPENHNKVAELKTAHKNKIQEILKKHAEERKLLQKEIKVEAKRSREDLGKALKLTEKTYRSQLEQLRNDYESRSMKLQNELEVFLSGKMSEMKQQNQQVILTDSQERLEKLQEWLHGEFVTELQSKTNELEQVKASSDAQLQNLVHEVDQKNQEILFLHNKIKEISQHLKKGLREEVFSELGLKDDTSSDEKTKKKKKHQKIGLFARLSSKF